MSYRARPNYNYLLFLSSNSERNESHYGYNTKVSYSTQIRRRSCLKFYPVKYRLKKSLPSTKSIIIQLCSYPKYKKTAIQSPISTYRAKKQNLRHSPAVLSIKNTICTYRQLRIHVWHELARTGVVQGILSPASGQKKNKTKRTVTGAAFLVLH